MDARDFATLPQRLGSDRLEGVTALYLFGSHARGTPHRESDIDLGVLFDRMRHPSAEARAAAAERLAAECIAALHQNDVQVVVLNDAPPLLARHVVYEGRPLWSRDLATLRELERDVQMRAADVAPWLRRMRAIKLQYLREGS